MAMAEALSHPIAGRIHLNVEDLCSKAFADMWAGQCTPVNWCAAVSLRNHAAVGTEWIQKYSNRGQNPRPS